LINELVAICLLWVCIRIPAWARHMVFAGGGRRSLVGTVIRTLIVAKAVGVARGALTRRGGRGPSGPAGTRIGRSPGGPGGPIGPRPGWPGGPRGPRGPRTGPRDRGGGPGTAGDRSPRRPYPMPRSGSGAADPRSDRQLAVGSTPSAHPAPARQAHRGRRTPGWPDAAPGRLTTLTGHPAGAAAGRTGVAAGGTVLASGAPARTTRALAAPGDPVAARGARLSPTRADSMLATPAGAAGPSPNRSVVARSTAPDRVPRPAARSRTDGSAHRQPGGPAGARRLPRPVYASRTPAGPTSPSRQSSDRRPGPARTTGTPGATSQRPPVLATARSGQTRAAAPNVRSTR
jgi:hypothetical protein